MRSGEEKQQLKSKLLSAEYGGSQRPAVPVVPVAKIVTATKKSGQTGCTQSIALVLIQANGANTAFACLMPGRFATHP